MSSSRLLDFFVLEATDYIDRLDALLAESEVGRPDAELLTAQARLLRGSATMARQAPVADLASALERIGRALRDDIIPWSEELRMGLTAGVDDLKILVRAVRNWGAGDDRRTEERLSELVSLYPQATKTHPTPPSNTIRNSSFIASESAQLATALDNLVVHPSPGEAMGVAIHRLSSLRGVAAVNDTPPLGLVLEALEDILRPLHNRSEMPSPQHLAVLSAAIHLLRRFSQEIAIGGRPTPTSHLVDEFQAALKVLTPDASHSEEGDEPEATEQDGDGIVPISSLNFEDGLPQLVESTGTPPGMAVQRSRMEIVGPSEHLRHQVALARSTSDDFKRSGIESAIRTSLRSLRHATSGYAGNSVATFISSIEGDVDGLQSAFLLMVDELAATLLDDSLNGLDVQTRLDELLETRRTTAEIGAAFSASDASGDASAPTQVRAVSPTPARTASPTPARATSPSPMPVPTAVSAEQRPEAGATTPAPDSSGRSGASMSGAGLASALEVGIASFSDLEANPLSAPEPIDEDEVVPIEDLLYRGRDAIERALEIRDELKSGARAPQAEELSELFELLELALTE